VRQGYGEMMWIDGSIYKGYWEKGIQHGLGVMIFPDGFKKVGFFDNNIFVTNLDSIDQFYEFQQDLDDTTPIPETLVAEVKEYLGL
jgi:hypothetical protein